LELPKEGNLVSAAKQIVLAMSQKLGDSVGKVLRRTSGGAGYRSCCNRVRSFGGTP